MAPESLAKKKTSKRLKKPVDYICSFCSRYYVQKGKKKSLSLTK